MGQDLEERRAQDPFLPATIEEENILARYMNQIMPDELGRGDSLAQLPTQAERGVLAGRARALHRRVSPISLSQADMARAQRAIAAMFGGFPQFKPDDPRKVVAGYVTLMRDMPAFAIEAACEDVLRNRAPDFKPEFGPPTVPRLITLCAEHMRELVAERERIKRVLSVKIERNYYEASDAERAKVGAMLAGLGETLRSNTAARDIADRQARDWAMAYTDAMVDNITMDIYARAGIAPVFDHEGRPIHPSKLARSNDGPPHQEERR